MAPKERTLSGAPCYQCYHYAANYGSNDGAAAVKATVNSAVANAVPANLLLYHCSALLAPNSYVCIHAQAVASVV